MYFTFASIEMHLTEVNLEGQSRNHSAIPKLSPLPLNEVFSSKTVASFHFIFKLEL